MAKEKHSNFINASQSDYKKATLTPKEIVARDFETALISELINARKALGCSQKNLEALSGVKKHAIARLEQGRGSRISSVLKVLAALDKTLEIVPIENISVGKKE